MKTFWSRAGLAMAAGLLSAVALPTANAQNPTVVNPGFETPDAAAPTVKPQGWFRATYTTNKEPGAVNRNSVVAPWQYITNGTPGDTTRTGTHSVAVAGNPHNDNTLYSWELEGLRQFASPAGWDASLDNRGQGSLIAVQKEGLYRISAWFKRTGGNGTGQLRYVFNVLNQANGWTGGGRVSAAAGPTNGWVELSAVVRAESSFLSLKCYNQNLDPGTTQYWDDISVELVKGPTTMTGTVKDSGGAAVPDAYVAIRPEGSNAWDAPVAAVKADANGAFSITFARFDDTDYFAQAWLPEKQASANTPVPASGELNITYTPGADLVNVLANKPVVAVSSKEHLLQWSRPQYANDDNPGTRWTSRGTDIGEEPMYIVWDMGAPLDFSKVSQIEMWWENARPVHYQIKVSNTPPDLAMHTPQNAGNNKLADTWGTVAYDTGQIAAWQYFQWPDNTYEWLHVLNTFNPVSGRYVMLYMDQAGPFPNFSPYEIRIQAPAATVTGRVVDAANAPVEGATILMSRNGPAYTTVVGEDVFQVVTDSSGNYTIEAGQGIENAIWASKASADGTEMAPVSERVTVTPTGATATAPDIVLPAAVPNVIPAGADADAYFSTTPVAPVSPESATDQQFFTNWTSEPVPNQNPAPTYEPQIMPSKPYYFIVDLGSQKTFNELSIFFGNENPGAYSIQVANNYNMAGRSGGDWQTVYRQTVAPYGYLEDAFLFGDGVRLERALFDTQTARYIRLVFEEANQDNTGTTALFTIWELQAGVVSTPRVPLALATQALKVAGGLEAATSGNFAALNAAGGTTIDVADAVALARQGM